MGHHYQPVFGAGLPEAVYRWQTSRQVKKKGKQHGPVVQLVRMPACHAGGRGFEPLPGRHYRFKLNYNKFLVNLI